MRNVFTLGIGLVIGLMGGVLFLRAGLPPALVAIAFWMVGGAIGISLIQFAFMGKCVTECAAAARTQPLRAFLLGLLILELPFFLASCFQLAGAEGMAALPLLAFFGSLVLVLWPANIAYLVGQRLLPGESVNRQVTAGSCVASTAALVPVLGWLWLFYLATLTTGSLCLRGRHV